MATTEQPAGTALYTGSFPTFGAQYAFSNKSLYTGSWSQFVAIQKKPAHPIALPAGSWGVARESIQSSTRILSLISLKFTAATLSSFDILFNVSSLNSNFIFS